MVYLFTYIPLAFLFISLSIASSCFSVYTLLPFTPAMISILAATFVLALLRWWYTRSRLPSPPGPRPLPIIGNIHQAPKTYRERAYHEWTKIYGPIYKMQYGPQSVIILGDYETAHQLLDKRSNIYSSRPWMPMAAQCVGRGLHSVLMPYDTRFRAHQRLMKGYLNNRTAQAYTTVQDLESKQVVLELLSTSDFSRCYNRSAASLIISLAYGKRLPRGDEPELLRIQQVLENFVHAAQIGVWIVDLLPFLNYLPTWLAPWKRTGNQMYKYESTVHSENFAAAHTTPSWNWCKQVSTKSDLPVLDKAYNVGLIFMAGTDTVSITLEFFTIAAILNPQIQKAAQAELDKFVGRDRLPTFADKDNLKYINAIILEVLRWRQVIATGIPHATTQDDEYLGYHIPKGSIVMANSWALGHDENIFPEPETFRPERWIENPDLPVHFWGFGRRSCPGRHVAMNSLFIHVARLLWAFDIEHAYEEVNGQKVRCEIDPMAILQEFSQRPVPFKAVFKPRSGRAGEVVRREWDASKKDLDVMLTEIGKFQEKAQAL